MVAWDLDTLARAWAVRQAAGDCVAGLAAGPAGCVWGAAGEGVVMWELPGAGWPGPVWLGPGKEAPAIAAPPKGVDLSSNGS